MVPVTAAPTMMIDHDEYKPLLPRYMKGNVPAVPLDDIVVEGSQYDFTKIVAPKPEGGWELLKDSPEAQRLRTALEEVFENKGVFLLRDTGLTEMDPTGGGERPCTPNP